MNLRVSKRMLLISAVLVTAFLFGVVLLTGCEEEAVGAERGSACSAVQAKACASKGTAAKEAGCPADCDKACCAAKKKAGTCPKAEGAKTCPSKCPKTTCEAKKQQSSCTKSHTSSQ
ncbi:MAG: hypothetical protein ACYS1A_05270 [Planctomycetota bacterium]